MKGKCWVAKRALGTMVGIGLACTSMAAPTSLILMPIADIMGHREFLYAPSGVGDNRRMGRSEAYAHAVTFGLFDRVEMGFDNDFLGSTVYNAKVLLYEAPKTKSVAVSAGLMNMNVAEGPITKYVVGRFDVGSTRLHAGWLRDDRDRLMLGVDRDLGHGWSVMADYISGPNNYTWVAVNIPTPVPGLSFMLGEGIPSVHADGYQHNVTLNYGFRL